MRYRNYAFLVVMLTIFLVTAALAALGPGEMLAIEPSAENGAAVVEWIDWGDLHSLSPSFIFYGPRQDLDTNPCVKSPETVVYGRVPHGGGKGDALEILGGCDAPQSTWFVVDNLHIYYIRKATNEYVLVRRSIDGLAPDELLDTDVEAQALAIDNDYVYYAKGSGQTTLDKGIWRIKKDGPGVPQKLIDIFDIVDARINRLLLDGNTLYWTEGIENNGAVRSGPKAGGAWSGIAMVGVKGARDIKSDLKYVYWSEVGGRIMRHPKAGGAEQNLHTAELAVHYIDVADDVLVFTQGIGRDGSIWRMPAAGGKADPLVSAQSTPGPISINSDYIYWNSSALKRIPVDADPISLDYVIDWVEVTQGIQNGNNSVPLVAQRETSIRVYAHEAKGDSPALVRVAMTVKGPNGTPFAGSPLLSGSLNVPNARPSRADTNDTFLFTLPEEWIRAGKISLEFEINPLVNGQQAFETNKINNQYSAGTVSFAARGMCVLTYPVATETVFGGVQLVTQNDAAYFAHYDRAESMLPAPIGPIANGMELWKANGDPFDLSFKPDREELKATMGLLAAFGDDPYNCGESFSAVQGLVHPNALLPDNVEGGKTKGQGFSNPPVSWVQMSAAADINAGYNSPTRGPTFAHELAHTTGNGHVGCGVQPQDNSYPYPVEQLDNNDGEMRHWGFDPFSNSAINPVDNADFRSYCSPRWVSDYTWKKVGGFATVSGENGDPAADHRDAPMLQLDPDIDYTSGLGTLGTGWVLEEADLTGQQQRMLAISEDLRGVGSDFGIAQRDNRGNLLSMQPFEPEESPDEPGVPGVTVYSDANLNVQYFDEKTKVIQLVDRRSNAVLDEVHVSDNEPEVTAVAVQVNPRNSTVSVSWEARDPDKDVLHYLVRYSSDGGDSWRPVSLVLSEKNLTFGTADLAGADGTAVVEVIATDGVHTGMGLSGSFSIPKKEPFAIIVSPASGKRISEANEIILAGRAFDVEDGPLSGRGLTWFLDGAEVGYGRWLFLSQLAAGKHTVRLRAMDNDGNRVSDWITVIVEELPGPQPPEDSGPLFLPIVLTN